MALSEFINSNPHRQYVLDYLRDSMWFAGDLSFVRKVTSAIWDETYALKTAHLKEVEAEGWENVKLRLIEAWKRDLACYKDISKVTQGELTGLSPDVLQIVHGIFPDISHYSKKSVTRIASPDSKTESALILDANSLSIPKSPDGAGIEDFTIPRRRSSGKLKAIAVSFLAIAIIVFIYFTGPSLLPLFGSIFPPQNSTPDTTPPVFTAVFPVNGSVAIPNSTIMVRFSDDRAVNLSSVLITVNNVTVMPTRLTPYEAEYDPGLNSGKYAVSMSISDMSNNTASVSWSFNISSSILEAVVNEVLSEINTNRAAVGLPPVSLTDVSVATAYRSQDMLVKGYFNHYDTNGYLPTLYYTSFGGLYTIEENIGYIFTNRLDTADVPAQARSLVHNMVYNDASSNWGHRDSILDPTNNYADIYASWTANRLFLTIHMVKSWVNWTSPPKIENGIFSCSGEILMPNSSLLDAFVYYSNPAEHQNMTYDQSLQILRGEGSYSLGSLVAGVVPEPYYYTGIQAVRPIFWRILGSSFSLSFRTSALSGPGAYTINLLAENTINISHPWDPSKYAGELPILSYTIYLP